MLLFQRGNAGPKLGISRPSAPSEPDSMGRGRFATQLDEEVIGNGGGDRTNAYEQKRQKFHWNLNGKSTNRLDHCTGI
jgi:hypothetical protein